MIGFIVPFIGIAALCMILIFRINLMNESRYILYFINDEMEDRLIFHHHLKSKCLGKINDLNNVMESGFYRIECYKNNGLNKYSSYYYTLDCKATTKELFTVLKTFQKEFFTKLPLGSIFNVTQRTNCIEVAVKTNFKDIEKVRNLTKNFEDEIRLQNSINAKVIVHA